MNNGTMTRIGITRSEYREWFGMEPPQGSSGFALMGLGTAYREYIFVDEKPPTAVWVNPQNKCAGYFFPEKDTAAIQELERMMQL